MRSPPAGEEIRLHQKFLGFATQGRGLQEGEEGGESLWGARVGGLGAYPGSAEGHC